MHATKEYPLPSDLDGTRNYVLYLPNHSRDFLDDAIELLGYVCGGDADQYTNDKDPCIRTCLEIREDADALDDKIKLLQATPTLQAGTVVKYKVWRFQKKLSKFKAKCLVFDEDEAES